MTPSPICEKPIQNKDNHTWKTPISFVSSYDAEIPYPVNALPKSLQKAVTAYQAYGQQPLSLVASGALANISLACQSLANVARDKYLVSPLSLYFLMVAGSGERKSAADSVFSKAIRKWESKIRAEREPKVQSALLLHKAWQMERDGLLAQIKRSMTTGVDNDFYQEPPHSLEALDDYETRLTDCLNQSRHLNQQGCTHLPIISMSDSAKKSWICFFNSIESGLSQQGQWSSIKDFASKAAENAARLGALYHLFEGKSGDIQAQSIEQAIEIINWHLQETRRLLDVKPHDSPLNDTIKLMNWLIDKNIEVTTLRALQRLSPIRNKAKLEETLIEHHIVRIEKIGSTSSIHLNPHCL